MCGRQQKPRRRRWLLQGFQEAIAGLVGQPLSTVHDDDLSQRAIGPQGNALKYVADVVNADSLRRP